MAEWYFRRFEKGMAVRNPVQSEFFATGAISDPGVALVREGIQNSLDAALPGETVLVRIYLSGEEAAVAPRRVHPYLEGTWKHISAEDSGLRPSEVPSLEQPCPFMVFEDFGTRGLEGDPAEPFRPKGQIKNHFYHFFRAEGQSDKEATDRGVWGVGKHIFLRSSSIRCMFGLTVRAQDGSRLLMGKTVLNAHWVGDIYYQDGLFGVPPYGEQPLVMPVTDSADIDEFCAVFDLQREHDSGLSVVIPWPDPETTDNSIVRAVLRGYFYPILTGQLEVIVETPRIKMVLDADKVVSETENIGNELAEELRPLLQLADWARQVPTEEKASLEMPDPRHAWSWSEELFAPELLGSLQESFREGRKLAVRVPVTVREKGAPAQESFFDVFLVRDATGRRGRPVFVREGIIIPAGLEVPRTRSLTALVIIDDPPMAAFLRDAENPSHTEWQHNGSNFRGKYRSGRSDLAFLKRSVHEIVSFLTLSEEEEDTDILIDFFSLPPLPEEEPPVTTPEEEPGEEPGERPPTVPPIPPPVPPRFRITKFADGFSIHPAKEPLPPGAVLDIRVAYDTRSGNPLLGYRPYDFDLASPPIALAPEPAGMRVLQCSGNHIRVQLTEPEFSLHVTGFDENRDLYTRVLLEGNADADQTL